MSNGTKTMRVTATMTTDLELTFEVPAGMSDEEGYQYAQENFDGGDFVEVDDFLGGSFDWGGYAEEVEEDV